MGGQFGFVATEDRWSHMNMMSMQIQTEMKSVHGRPDKLLAIVCSMIDCTYEKIDNFDVACFVLCVSSETITINLSSNISTTPAITVGRANFLSEGGTTHF